PSSSTSAPGSARRGEPMHDAERYRLLFGPYTAPPFAYGQVLPCAVRGPAIVCGLSAGRIPWPVGKRSPRSGARFLIITGGLAEAVRRESAIAVSYWWGVGRTCGASVCPLEHPGLDPEAPAELTARQALRQWPGCALAIARHDLLCSWRERE